MHPCRRATIGTPTINNVSYTLRNSQNEDQEIVEPQDDVSLIYDSGDGYETCGERAFYIQDESTGLEATWVHVIRQADLTPEEALTIDLTNKFIIRVSVDDENLVGTISFTFKMWFVNYPPE